MLPVENVVRDKTTTGCLCIFWMMFWTILMEVSLGQIWYDTVDGRNPAPVDKYFIPLCTVFFTSQVISRISEPSTVLFLAQSLGIFFTASWILVSQPKIDWCLSPNDICNSTLELLEDESIFGFIFCFLSKWHQVLFTFTGDDHSYRTWRLRAGELCGRRHPSWAIVMGS